MSFRERGYRDEDFGPRERPALGMTPGVVFRTEQNEMAKAESDGTYTLEQNGETLHFFIAKGDELPEGAKFQAAEGQPANAAKEEKAVNAAPENKAK